MDQLRHQAAGQRHSNTSSSSSSLESVGSFMTSRCISRVLTLGGGEARRLMWSLAEMPSAAATPCSLPLPMLGMLSTLRTLSMPGTLSTPDPARGPLGPCPYPLCMEAAGIWGQGILKAQYPPLMQQLMGANGMQTVFAAHAQLALIIASRVTASRIIERGLGLVQSTGRVQRLLATTTTTETMTAGSTGAAAALTGQYVVSLIPALSY